MTEYALRLPHGRVVRGPGWTCEGDVIAAAHGQGRRMGGDLVVSVNGGPWRPATRHGCGDPTCDEEHP